MEQWVLDGRDTIRDRGFSRIPAYVEEDGYTIDTTGVRGMLKKASGSGGGHKDPTINYAKGLPQLYAECEVDYEYRFNGRIVDTNRESLALEELLIQQKKEEAELIKMKEWEEKLEAQSASAIAKDKHEAVVAGADSETKKESAESPSAVDTFKAHAMLVDGSNKAAFPTPSKIPSIGPYYPLDLVLGAGQVTQAMDEAILSMYEGEETEWWVDPAFAFRDHGLRTKFGSIPSDAPIQMKVKLLRFENPMSSYERIMYATRLKDEANEALKKALNYVPASPSPSSTNQQPTVTTVTPTTTPSATSVGAGVLDEAHRLLWQEAVLAYNNALTKLGKTFVFKKKSPPREPLAVAAADAASVPPSTAATDQNDNNVKEEVSREEQIVLDNQLRAIIFTNLALCWFKRDDLARSTEYTDRSLKHDPFYSKAYFRRALIEERRCNFDEAIGFLEKIQENVAAGKATDAKSIALADVDTKIAQLKATSAQQDSKQRKTFQGMFK